MRYLVFMAFALAICCQTKKRGIEQAALPTDSLSDNQIDEFDYDCVYHKTNKKLSNTYPFSESDKIELVSYEEKKRYKSVRNDELIKDGRFVVPDIHQRTFLAQKQIDSLFSIIYNLESPTDSISHADCYNPRHSIVFYSKERAIAFLEICFSCHGTRQSKNMDLGEFCSEKYCILERFFITNKIKFGIEKEEYINDCTGILKPESFNQ